MATTRRSFIVSTGLVASCPFASTSSLRARPDGDLPTLPYGVQAGDIGDGAAVIWAACDRPARMIVQWATEDRPEDVRAIAGPAALPETGGTAKVLIEGLPDGADVHYLVTFRDLEDLRVVSAPVAGRFRAPPADRRDVTFIWSGDTAGQGWGINPEWGGMRLYEVMRAAEPDFFVHCGDMIYADGPIEPEVVLADGTVWRNVVTKAKRKVAETLEEYRGNYRYNLLDEHVRRFNGEVGQYTLWDDHEVTNNWYHERVLEDERYAVRSAALLAARGEQAMREFTPTRIDPTGRGRKFRAFRRGPLLDLLLLDMRSHRGPNGPNRQTELTDDARILGREQTAWLKQRLASSNALWKVIAADMPLGLVVGGASAREAVAQGEDQPLGRELEIAEILKFIRDEGITNVIWLTADVHYCATHHYTPERADFKDFSPFYEFVSGPIHAGTYGPNRLDMTFGPEVVFQKAHPQSNAPPTDGYLFFGHVRIDGDTGELSVEHRDLSGSTLHRTDIQPEG